MGCCARRPQRARRCRLAVFGIAVGGRWASETATSATFIRLLASARAAEVTASLRTAAPGGAGREMERHPRCCSAASFVSISPRVASKQGVALRAGFFEHDPLPPGRWLSGRRLHDYYPLHLAHPRRGNRLESDGAAKPSTRPKNGSLRWLGWSGAGHATTRSSRRRPSASTPGAVVCDKHCWGTSNADRFARRAGRVVDGPVKGGLLVLVGQAQATPQAICIACGARWGQRERYLARHSRQPCSGVAHDVSVARLQSRQQHAGSR